MAKPPSAGPHQPQRASAVLGVATVATAIALAAVRAITGFLMAFTSSVAGVTVET
jgi:hypothetical protein